ncbi:hypothetical protein AWC38_SpisGene18363 [Stylophora pistillata]|uniref:Mab-21-like nucleotidyltransferase domain-containing protein n=1 Tax=Stylophora pistillata TaxID=50429 RepID=A0A2B4RG20_STYPI|nr:hypothetical protein AWC38_SpisGene18363 [Stylophora pistillata]
MEDHVALELVVGSQTSRLSEFSADHVNISEADMTRSRKLVKEYRKNQVMWYCPKKSTLPILRLEYTGSVYERLKTEAADGKLAKFNCYKYSFFVKIIHEWNDLPANVVEIVLKASTAWLWDDPEVMVDDTDVPGYVRLKARSDSKYRKYAGPVGYINPERLRNGWFYSLVDEAVDDFRARVPRSDVNVVVRQHGPAVQVDIFKKGTSYIDLLSVDLVPCFQIGSDNYYMAKSYGGRRFVSSPGLLWWQSFSLKEKELLEYMDRDHG